LGPVSYEHGSKYSEETGEDWANGNPFEGEVGLAAWIYNELEDIPGGLPSFNTQEDFINQWLAGGIPGISPYFSDYNPAATMSDLMSITGIYGQLGVETELYQTNLGASSLAYEGFGLQREGATKSLGQAYKDLALKREGVRRTGGGVVTGEMSFKEKQEHSVAQQGYTASLYDIASAERDLGVLIETYHTDYEDTMIDLFDMEIGKWNDIYLREEDYITGLYNNLVAWANSDYNYGGCTSNDECGLGFDCNIVTGECEQHEEISCGEGGGCPPGYTCSNSGWCIQTGADCLDDNDCGYQQVCGPANACINIDDAEECVPYTEEYLNGLGQNCGTVADGCGGFINLGGCGSGEECIWGSCQSTGGGGGSGGIGCCTGPGHSPDHELCRSRYGGSSSCEGCTCTRGTAIEPPEEHPL